MANFNKSPIYGVGINDVDYPVSYSIQINGVRHQEFCPIYLRWKDMLHRCYCDKSLAKREYYQGCTVCDEWKYFSKFKEWVLSQPVSDWQTKHLDKDLLVKGNKVYSPDTCIFIEPSLNSFNTGYKLDNGNLRGASYNNHQKKFQSRCGNPFTGKRELLGYFKTELEAHLVWKARKHELACILADMQTDTRLAESLRNLYSD